MSKESIKLFINSLGKNADDHLTASEKLHQLKELLSRAEDHIEVFHPFIESIQYSIGILDEQRAMMIEFGVELSEKYGIEI